MVQRPDDDSNEAHLTLGDRHGGSVTLGRDRESQTSLSVALQEELLHHESHPLSVDLGALQRVADVGSMDQGVETSLFVTLAHV